MKKEIILSNGIILKEDFKSKSKSFYLLNPYQKIDKIITKFLLKYSSENNTCDLRVCIHESPKSKHQRRD